MRWHVPSIKELEFAEQLLNEFAYPEIIALQKPEKMDKYVDFK